MSIPPISGSNSNYGPYGSWGPPNEVSDIINDTTQYIATGYEAYEAGTINAANFTAQLNAYVTYLNQEAATLQLPSPDSTNFQNSLTHMIEDIGGIETAISSPNNLKALTAVCQQFTADSTNALNILSKYC